MAQYKKVIVEGKVGYQNQDGEMVIAPQYEDGPSSFGGESSKDTSYAVVLQKGKYGLINQKGEEIIPFEYEKIVYEGGGVALLCKDGKWGAKGITLMTKFWGVDIPLIYKEIKTFGKYLFGVKVETNEDGESFERYTIVDKNGDEIKVMWSEFGSKCFESNFIYFNDDKLLTSFHGKYGFISLNGYISIPFIYDAIVERKDGRFDVEQDGKWGIIDLDGRRVVEVKFDAPPSLKVDNSIVKDMSSGKLGVLSMEGMEKIPCIYDSIIVAVPEEKLYEDIHLYDGFGQYADEMSRYERLAQYIGTDETETYIYAGYGASDGYDMPTLLRSGIDCCNWGCYDSTGKMVIPPYYDNIEICNDYFFAKRNGRCYLYNKTGELLLDGSEWDNKSKKTIFYVKYGFLGEYIVAKEAKTYLSDSTYVELCNLYNKNFDLILGGFNDIDITDGFICLHYGGYWKIKHEREDFDNCGNYIGEEWDEHVWKEGNGRWLIVDSDLKSVIRKQDGSEYCFNKGAICTITPKTENGKTISYWSFPLELFSMSKPVISHGIAVVGRNSKKIATRICDGVCSPEYKGIEIIDDLTLFVEEEDKHISHIGLISFDKTIIGTDEEFVFLTKPVCGIVFGVKSTNYLHDKDIVELICVDTTGDSNVLYTARKNITFQELRWALRRGELELIVEKDESGRDLLCVRNMNIFDSGFIENIPYKFVTKEKEYKQEVYWYSDLYLLKTSLKQQERDRLISYKLNDPDFSGRFCQEQIDDMYDNGYYDFWGDFKNRIP